MPSPILRYFSYDHLPAHLQDVSSPLGQLAKQLDESLPDGQEKSAGLRKLLEAKDCFVRAAIDKEVEKNKDNVPVGIAPVSTSTTRESFCTVSGSYGTLAVAEDGTVVVEESTYDDDSPDDASYRDITRFDLDDYTRRWTQGGFNGSLAGDDIDILDISYWLKDDTYVEFAHRRLQSGTTLTTNGPSR